MAAFLADTETASRMSPLEHLEWVRRSLPLISDRCQAPDILEDALKVNSEFTPKEISNLRAEARQHWLERKRVLDPTWRNMFTALPEHVRSVLGPEKNLLLLGEMLQRAGSRDHSLIEHLSQGFPMIGRLPRSGSARLIDYTQPTETRSSLLQAAGDRNIQMLLCATSDRIHV